MFLWLSVVWFGMKEQIKETPKAIESYVWGHLGPTDIIHWYLANPQRAIHFVDTCKKFESKGYRLDKRSGFLLRELYNDQNAIEKIGRTILDIVFTRPTNIHHHTDVEEAIHMESGEGLLYLFDKNTQKFEKYKLDATIPDIVKSIKYIPVGIPHCFDTDVHNPLEIRLVCTGILKDENEITLRRFDKWDGKKLVNEGL